MIFLNFFLFKNLTFFILSYPLQYIYFSRIYIGQIELIFFPV